MQTKLRTGEAWDKASIIQLQSSDNNISKKEMREFEWALTADNGRIQTITMQISFFFLRIDVSMKIDVRGDDKVKATGIGVHDKFVWYT